eukprot:g3747.t1
MDRETFGDARRPPRPGGMRRNRGKGKARTRTLPSDAHQFPFLVLAGIPIVMARICPLLLEPRDYLLCVGGT